MPQPSSVGRSDSSWFNRVTRQLAPSQTSPSTRSDSPPPANDRVQLSGSGVSRGSLLERARSRVGRLLGGTSETIQEVGSGGSRLVQGFSDFVGGGVRGLNTLIGNSYSGITRGGSQLIAGGLELAGDRDSAARVRRTGDTAARLIEDSTRQSGDIMSNFISGVGDGAGDLVEGIGTAVANPGQTLEALGRLDQMVNPVSQIREVVIEGRSPVEVFRENMETADGIVEGFREGYRQTGEDHGTAGQAGRAAFDVLSTVLTGGSGAAGRTGLRATTNVLDDVARTSRAVASGAQVPGDVGRVARATGGALGRRASGPLGAVSERLTRAAERLSEAGVRRAEGREARALSRGQERIRRGDVPGADGAEILSPARGRADSLRTQLGDNRTAWESGGAGRDALIDELPEGTRRRVRELEAEGRSDQALELVQRHQVSGAIRDSLEEAGRVDELYPTQLPADVDPSRVLARGRRESLEYLLGDTNLSADGLRRNFRHIVGDSDITGPVYIQEFRAGDQVGRAFSSSAGRETGVGSGSRLEGGYYGSVDDARRSRRQIQAGNALGLDNHADRFATFTLPEDTYGVVSQIGEQFQKYGDHAVGGNVQITFPGSIQPANPAVTDVGRISRRAQGAANATVGTGQFGRVTGEDPAENQN